MPTLDQLEAALSPHAKHAFETYRIAFERCDPAMTVAELRACVERLYGKEVAEELRDHFAERIAAVLPKP